MANLSERRKADRETIASAVHALALECGASSEIDRAPFGDMCPRMVMVNMQIAGVSLHLDFDGDSPQPDVFVLSWRVDRGSDKRLAELPGWSVNPYHFHKATDIAEGFDELKAILMARLIALADGTAFQN